MIVSSGWRAQCQREIIFRNFYNCGFDAYFQDSVPFFSVRSLHNDIVKVIKKYAHLLIADTDLTQLTNEKYIQYLTNSQVLARQSAQIEMNTATPGYYVADKSTLVCHASNKKCYQSAKKFFSVINKAQQIFGLSDIQAVRKQSAQVNKQWQLYLDKSLVQMPWELYLNSKLFLSS